MQLSHSTAQTPISQGCQVVVDSTARWQLVVVVLAISLHIWSGYHSFGHCILPYNLMKDQTPYVSKTETDTRLDDRSMTSVKWLEAKDSPI